MRKLFAWILLFFGAIMIFGGLGMILTVDWKGGFGTLLSFGIAPLMLGLYLLKVKLSKKNTVIGILTSLVAGLFLIGFSDGLGKLSSENKKDASPSSTTQIAMQELTYQIVGKDSNGYSLNYEIVIPKRYEEKDLIEIMRRIKTERKWGNKLEAFFFREILYQG